MFGKNVEVTMTFMPVLTTTLDNVLKVYRIKQGMNVWSNVIACV